MWAISRARGKGGIQVIPFLIVQGILLSIMLLSFSYLAYCEKISPNEIPSVIDSGIVDSSIL
jgi:hypothetical protein